MTQIKFLGKCIVLELTFLYLKNFHFIFINCNEFSGTDFTDEWLEFSYKLIIFRVLDSSLELW